MNRRRFVETLAASACATSLRGAPTGPQPSIQFPTDLRARIGVASYPFRKDFDRTKGGKNSLLEFPKMVVEQFQVHGIEPLDEHFESTDAGYLGQLRDALTATQTRVVNIPVGRLRASFYDPDPAKRSTAVSNARKWVDVAATLQSPSIRVHIQEVEGLEPDVRRAAESLLEVAHYGKEKNVVVNLENDDPKSEDAFYIVQIIAQANTPWLRALPDFCNSMLLNKGRDYNTKAVTAMFRNAFNICHVKEQETDEGKLFKIDTGRLFSIAADSGYRGYFSMEWDSDGDPYQGTKHLIDLTIKSQST